jgi:hypothetical protein
MIVCLIGCRGIPRDDIGSQKVRACGHIVRRVYPGPPEYECIAKGDRPDTYWILIADHPVKNTAHTEFAQPIPPEGVIELQLLLNGDQYNRYSPLVGKHIEVRGICFWAQVGGHYTPLLIKVKDIYLSSKN